MSRPTVSVIIAAYSGAGLHRRGGAVRTGAGSRRDRGDRGTGRAGGLCAGIADRSACPRAARRRHADGSWAGAQSGAGASTRPVHGLGRCRRSYLTQLSFDAGSAGREGGRGLRAHAITDWDGKVVREVAAVGDQLSFANFATAFAVAACASGGATSRAPGPTCWPKTCCSISNRSRLSAVARPLPGMRSISCVGVTNR